ncbi:MAG: hypothetical protein Q4G70_13910 [Pseudomonadota bacterium]|nr:hypothetical protein [Pseudomonadota bacterium]
MPTYLNPAHSLHAPCFAFFRGERVACLRGPARTDFVEQALRAGGHAAIALGHNAVAVLEGFGP